MLQYFLSMPKKKNCQALISIIKQVDKEKLKPVLFIQDYRILEIELSNIALRVRYNAILHKKWTGTLEKELVAVIDKDLFNSFNEVTGTVGINIY